MEHMLTTGQAFALILVMTAVTVLTRILPFLLFDRTGQTPSPVIRYLGGILPSAIIAMLVVYVLRDVAIFAGKHGIPELIACIAVVVLHKWKHNYLISIFCGTVVYMLLI